MLDVHRPDPRMGRVFVDGERIASIQRQEDVGAALVPLARGR
jgi:hypothetical protein